MTVLGAHPARLDLYVHPGDPVDFSIPVLADDDTSPDLSGWTIAATATASDGQLLHTFTTSGSAGGLIEASATATETGAWAWTPYAARLVVTAAPPAGAAIPIATGWIRLYRP